MRDARGVRRAAVAAAVLVGACSVAVGVAPQPVAADVDYVFNVNCPISHFNSDDPIVFPLQTGVSHRHAFYGNVSTDSRTTTRSLLGSRSTCERGFDKADRSAYWVPTLYRKLANGTRQEIRLSRDNQHLSAYYRRSGGNDGVKVKPFPKGLRMIAGDPFSTKPQSTYSIAWHCNGDGREYGAPIPNCASGTTLRALVGFPDCWDGKRLDSADHRSHMTESRGEQGSCPNSHPVKLPQVTFEISFKMSPVAGSSFELSSGGQYSLHGDFFAAWDDKVQSALVNSCLNAGRYCENIKVSEVDLSAAGPVPTAPEPVISSPPPAASAPAGQGHLGHAPASAPPVAEPDLAAASADRTGSTIVVLAVAAGAAIAVALLYGYRRQRVVKGRRRVTAAPR